MKPSTCPRCCGLTYLDAGEGEYRVAPALACRSCGRRIELQMNGQPLVVVQPLAHGGPLEEQIRMMLSHGKGVYAIVRRLRCDVELVQEIGRERLANTSISPTTP